MATRHCRYCGQPIPSGQRSREHIIPKSLGCNAKISNVCSSCNSGELSRIDDELKSESPLKFLADSSDRSDWAYNPHFPFPLEHGIESGYSENKVWPQLLLLDSGSLFFFAPEQAVDPQDLLNVFLNCLALRISKQGPKALIWESVKARTPDFPTRVYTRHRYAEVSEKNHFFCRFVGGVDKDEVLYKIDSARKKFRKAKPSPVITPGNSEISGVFRYDIRKVKRALTKIGVNALARICSDTEITRDVLPQAIDFVRYERDSYDVKPTWFVNNHDIQWMRCPENLHKVHIECDRPWIKIHVAFYGGKAGAFVWFPGALREGWRRAELIMGAGRSRPVTRTFRTFVDYPTPRISFDPREIMPSVPFTGMDTWLEAGE